MWELPKVESIVVDREILANILLISFILELKGFSEKVYGRLRLVKSEYDNIAQMGNYISGNASATTECDLVTSRISKVVWWVTRGDHDFAEAHILKRTSSKRFYPTIHRYILPPRSI